MFARRLLFFVLLVAVAPISHAQEESSNAEEDAGPWSGSASLGYLATSGNTENASLNTGFKIVYEASDNWTHSLESLTIFATEADSTTAEAYQAALKSERSLTDHDFLFGLVRWRKDRFSSYDSQFAQTLGYGRRLIDGENHHLNLEIGAGARQSTLVDGSREDELILRGGFEYRWTVNDHVDFSQIIGIEAGEENNYTESVTAISADLFDDLALVASYTIKNNSNVLPGTENTDTYTALSLEYSF